MPDQVVETLTITIDGVPVEARKGELLIAAAERHGVYVPRFCYHPRMKPVGMCRMCLVEVDGPRGPSLQVSCMLPVAPDMVVRTDTPQVKKAQDGVLEFLLINHPLDCPVCDRGGECPLQDQTMSHGPGESRFVEEKRHYEKPIPLSDLVLMDRERCILCDRCTRFASEVAGDPLIHFVERGAQTQVLTFPDEPFASYFSGNTVQICPVGALLGKPYRFRARPWDLEQVESTCTSCSVGCRKVVQSSRNEIVRYLGIDADHVNWSWLCDRGRFDHEWVNAETRLGQPLRRDGDGLVPVRWPGALDLAAAGIRQALAQGGPSSVAVLGGARLTNEDAYAWAKLAKGVIGTDSVDCQLGDGLPAEAVLGLPKASIDDTVGAGVVVLLAPDIKEELPVLYLRLRQAIVDSGLKVVEITPQATGLTKYVTASLAYRPGEAGALVRALLGAGSASGVGYRDEDLAPVRELLTGAGDVVCVLGRPSVAESADSVLEAVGALRQAVPGVRFLSALRRSNVHGALDMGLAPGVLPGRVSLEGGRDRYAAAWPTVPAQRGLDAAGILTAAAEGRIGCLVLLGADPLQDFPDRDLARRALAGATYVVAVDCLPTASVELADVVLPAAGFAEKPGTTTNLEFRVSMLEQKVTAPGTARADWMIAAELAWRLDADLGVESWQDVLAEIERVAPSHRGLKPSVFEDELLRDGVLIPLDVAEALAADAHSDDAKGFQTSGGPELGDGERSEAIAESFQETGDRSQYDTGHPPDEHAQRAVEAGVEGSSGTAGEEGPDERAGYADPSGGGRGTRADAVLWDAPVQAAPLVPLDAYSLRLVSGRKLYDLGSTVQASSSLAPLAPGAVLGLNPYDFDRLGVAPGTRVRLSSSRTAVVAEARPDPGVPRGSASLPFNQPGVIAADLIDVTSPVTDVRVETIVRSEA